MTNNVQSVLMKRQYWSLACAKKWLKDHNFKFTKVDVMPHYLWLRQFLPKRYKTYRIKKITPNNIISPWLLTTKNLAESPFKNSKVFFCHA